MLNRRMSPNFAALCPQPSGGGGGGVGGATVQNKLQMSEDLTNGVYTKTAMGVAAGVTSPTGKALQKLTPTAVNANHYVTFWGETPGTAAVMSAIIKQGVGFTTINFASDAGWEISFDLTTGVGTVIGGTIANKGLIDLTGGYFRVWWSVTGATGTYVGPNVTQSAYNPNGTDYCYVGALSADSLNYDGTYHGYVINTNTNDAAVTGTAGTEP